MTKPSLNTILKINFIVVITLAILNLVGTNLLATQGQQLNQIYAQTNQIRKENVALANDIAKESSLLALETWADSRGFVKVDKPLALTTPAPVAYLSR